MSSRLACQSGLLFFAISLVFHNAQAQSQAYPKHLKKAPVVEEEVQSEVIKPTPTPAPAPIPTAAQEPAAPDAGHALGETSGTTPKSNLSGATEIPQSTSSSTNPPPPELSNADPHAAKDKSIPADLANIPPTDVKPVDVLGPHQGTLRDAGLFKVELKTRKKGLDIFLINANSAAPLTEDSRVEGQLYLGQKEYELKFWPVPAQKKFFAAWPEEVRAMDDFDLKNKGLSVVLLPTREHVMGAPVLYRLDRIHE